MRSSIVSIIILFIGLTSADEELNVTLDCTKNGTNTCTIEMIDVSLDCTKYEKSIALCNIENVIDDRHLKLTQIMGTGISTYQWPKKIKFMNSTLRFIPTNIFELCDDIREFDISSTNISSIDSSVFKGMNNLRFLNISNNTIDNLPPYTFLDGKALEILDISYNKLVKIDEKNFHGLTKLIELDLSNNFIQTIELGAFEVLTSLAILKLDNNNLTKLDPGTFGKNPLQLQFLYLNNNKLTNFDLTSFKMILDTIDLSQNQLYVYIQNENYLAKNVILNYNQLTKLYLIGFVNSLEAHHNQISGIDLSTKIKKVYLSYNQIKDLTNFTKLINLRELDFSFNEIDIQDNSFELLTNLEELYIQKTNLKTIHLGTFYQQFNLRVLDISYNDLEKIDFDHFIAMNLLEELYIDGNSLHEINQKDIEDIFPELKLISISNNYWGCTYLTSIIKRMNSRRIKFIGDLEDEEKDSKTVVGIKCKQSSEGPFTPINYQKYKVPSHQGGIIKQKYEDMHIKMDRLITNTEFLQKNTEILDEKVILIKAQLNILDVNILNIKPIFPAADYIKQFDALYAQMDKISADLDQIKKKNNENINLVDDSNTADLYAKVNSQTVLVILIFVLALSFVLAKVVKFVYVRRVMFNRLNNFSSSTVPIIVEENL